jgi:hypothetical protein
MTELNQPNLPTDEPDSNALPSVCRFVRLTEDERGVLSDALRELSQVKEEAIEIAIADLGSGPRSHFSEHDFGIPAIERMLAELEDAP